MTHLILIQNEVSWKPVNEVVSRHLKMKRVPGVSWSRRRAGPRLQAVMNGFWNEIWQLPSAQTSCCLLRLWTRFTIHGGVHIKSSRAGAGEGSWIPHIRPGPCCTSITCVMQPPPPARSSPRCSHLSCWGTICMISYFAQLIKTWGRLAAELLVPRGDDRQLPQRRASLILSLSPPSLPLMFISSNRRLAFGVREARRMKWQEKKVTNVEPSHQLWSGLDFPLVYWKRKEHISHSLKVFADPSERRFIAVNHLVAVLLIGDITQEETPQLFM